MRAAVAGGERKAGGGRQHAGGQQIRECAERPLTELHANRRCLWCGSHDANDPLRLGNRWPRAYAPLLGTRGQHEYVDEVNTWFRTSIDVGVGAILTLAANADNVTERALRHAVGGPSIVGRGLRKFQREGRTNANADDLLPSAKDEGAGCRSNCARNMDEQVDWLVLLRRDDGGGRGTTGLRGRRTASGEEERSTGYPGTRKTECANP